jgi:hypothetical protein
VDGTSLLVRHRRAGTPRQCDRSVADALPFSQIEAVGVFKIRIGEKPVRLWQRVMSETYAEEKGLGLPDGHR